MSRRDVSDAKVYIGNLPRNSDSKEIERAFEKFGTLKGVWVARNPPGFAFVEFEDSRDAADAVREMDGTVLCDARVRVEHATGKSRTKGRISYGAPRRDYGRKSPSPRRGYDDDRRSVSRGRDSYKRNSRRTPTPARNRSRSRSNCKSRSRSPVRSRSPKRSRSPRRSRSPPVRSKRSRSPVHSRRSRSPSPKRSRSRSRSRS